MPSCCGSWVVLPLSVNSGPPHRAAQICHWLARYSLSREVVSSPLDAIRSCVAIELGVSSPGHFESHAVVTSSVDLSNPDSAVKMTPRPP